MLNLYSVKTESEKENPKTYSIFSKSRFIRNIKVFIFLRLDKLLI